MRITNNMIMKNSLSNINYNKTLYDNLNTQLGTEKKIQRASENPIIAIRALRLRASYSDICQYLEKNIPDAQHWLKSTEDALDSTTGLLSEFVYYCNQGVNDYNSVNERQILYTQLKQYRDEMYASANADYAGRTVFTGYKTDRTLSFEKDDLPANYKYKIEQTVSYDDIDTVNRITGCVDSGNVKEVYESDVLNNKIYRIQLAYKDIDAGISISGVDFSGSNINVSERTIAAFGNEAYNVGPDQVVLVPETGEILFGTNAYTVMKNSGDITVSYNKTGFEVGDLRPEHYFNCIDMSDPDATRHINYTISDQNMDYNINFNQKLTVNTLGKDVFSTGMARGIDDMMEAVNEAINAQNTVADIERQLRDTSDSTTKTKLNSMLAAAQLQLTYAEENMSSAFSKSISKYQGYLDIVNLAVADVGTKNIRLSLNEERLSSQKLSVEELKSQNEEVNVAEISTKLTAASNVYDASLAAAAMVIQKSLLDFL